MEQLTEGTGRTLKVVFMHEHGPGKRSGFVEIEVGAELSGKEPLYRKCAYLRMNLICREMHVTSSHEVPVVRMDMTETTQPAKSRRSIHGLADIEQIGNDKDSLSILGRDLRHKSVALAISEVELEEGAVEGVWLDGMKAFSDYETGVMWDEHFGVLVQLSSKRFQLLLSEVQIPGCVMKLSLNAGIFPNCFSEQGSGFMGWRGVVKFLADRKDVSNEDAIPVGFPKTEKFEAESLTILEWDGRQEFVDIHLSRPIARAEPHKPASVEEEEDDQPALQDSPMPDTIVSFGPQVVATMERISRRISLVLAIVAALALMYLFR